MLRDVIAYISTPQQHDLLRDIQVNSNEQLPNPKFRVKEVKKPGTTPCKSCHDEFERAVGLQHPLDAYMQYVPYWKVSDGNGYLARPKVRETVQLLKRC